MNNMQDFNNDRHLEEDLLPEYNFDYSQARPNRFNKALRAIISAIPKS